MFGIFWNGDGEKRCGQRLTTQTLGLFGVCCPWIVTELRRWFYSVLLRSLPSIPCAFLSVILWRYSEQCLNVRRVWTVLVGPQPGSGLALRLHQGNRVCTVRIDMYL